MKPLTLYSAIYNDFYPFHEWKMFADYKAVRHPDEMTEPGVLVVWGGEDISPSLYNRESGIYTGADDRPSRRDIIEWELMKGAKQKGMHIIGICRGAQMLCALAGGYLIQDVTGHAGGNHMIEFNNGELLQVCSVHHQMMAPWDIEHELIAWSAENRSKHYKDVNTDVSVPCEPEQVYFPMVRGHAIQWHPEFMSEDCEANQYVREYFNCVL